MKWVPLHKKNLSLGAWNVRTLLDRISCNRPERRTALVTIELSHYRIDIAALSETRFSDQGKLNETGAGLANLSLNLENRVSDLK